MADPCPICTLEAAMQGKSLSMAFRLLDAALSLEAICHCGGQRGHLWQHPHACPASQCAGWRMPEDPLCPR